MLKVIIIKITLWRHTGIIIIVDSIQNCLDLFHHYTMWYLLHYNSVYYSWYYEVSDTMMTSQTESEARVGITARGQLGMSYVDREVPVHVP